MCPITLAFAEEAGDYLIFDWNYKPNDYVNRVHVDDLDGDGVYEVIASSRDGVLYDLEKDATNHLNWQAILGGDVRSFRVVDFDGDGKKDVLAGAYKTGESARLIDWQGLDKGSTIEFDAMVQAIDAADIDGDGKNDIVIGSPSRKIYVLKSGEEPLWEYLSKGQVYYLDAADIDGDGSVEIVAASLWRKNEENLAEVYALDDKGNVKWTYSVKGGIFTAASDPFEVADLDGDGIKEVLVGTNSHGIDVLDSGGNLLWNFPTGNLVNVLYVSDSWEGGRPAVFAGARPYVYALDEKGDLLWELPVNTTVYSLHAADLDGDGKSEVLVGANKYVHIVSSDGDLLSTWMYGGEIQGLTKAFEVKDVNARSIQAGDLDGDGDNEIVIGFGWSEDRLDSNYYFGDVQVFEVNKDFEGPGKKTVTETTPAVVETRPPARTSTTVEETEPTIPEEPSTTSPETETQESGIPVMLVLAGLFGLFMVAVCGVMLYLIIKKKPPREETEKPQ
ncbi:MAG: FG-GAP repeat protein [Candidatus Altiarchaeota archaeon]|nr:FG-GAP repeat protein [Candidatus Altiarchaeota archaeon]